MNRRLVTAAAALLFCAVPALAQQKIAIANPIKILNELQETKDINGAMTQEQTTFKGDLAKKEEELKGIQGARDQLKPDAPQWAEKNNELVQKKAMAEAWAQNAQLDMRRRFRDQAKRMQGKIDVAINTIAKNKKIDIVVADQKPEVTDQMLDGMNPQQIMGVLFGRNVLYADNALDITQEVIAELDKVYKSPAPAAAPTPKP